MQAVLPVAVAVMLLALLPGCAEMRPCPLLDERGTIREVSGSDLTVRVVETGEIVVLHVSGAELYRRDPDGCLPITVGDITTGSNVAFQVDNWAESYPMQGWPEIVVIN